MARQSVENGTGHGGPPVGLVGFPETESDVLAYGVKVRLQCGGARDICA